MQACIPGELQREACPHGLLAPAINFNLAALCHAGAEKLLQHMMAPMLAAPRTDLPHLPLKVGFGPAIELAHLLEHLLCPPHKDLLRCRWELLQALYTYCAAHAPVAIAWNHALRLNRQDVGRAAHAVPMARCADELRADIEPFIHEVTAARRKRDPAFPTPHLEFGEASDDFLRLL